MKGWIKPIVSLYGNSMFFVQKPVKLQMLIDFHILNVNIKLDVFSLPCITNFIKKLGKAKCFSSIYLATAYHKVIITKGDKNKTIFSTNKGLYEYIVIPFVLYNALATF